MGGRINNKYKEQKNNNKYKEQDNNSVNAEAAFTLTRKTEFPGENAVWMLRAEMDTEKMQECKLKV